MTASTNYAGFWKRILAYLIDAILVGIVVGILGLFFGSDAAQSNPMHGPIGIAIGWLYFAYMESSDKQATLGKMVLNMKVTDMQGKRLSFLHATGRHFAKILSGIIIGIGFIMIAFTQKKQGLHDLIAGTLVVNK